MAFVTLLLHEPVNRGKYRNTALFNFIPILMYLGAFIPLHVAKATWEHRTKWYLRGPGIQASAANLSYCFYKLNLH